MLDPLNTTTTPPAICLRICSGFAMSTVPAPAPPIMSSSAGCSRHFDVAVLHQITTQHGAEYHHNSDDCEHYSFPMSARVKTHRDVRRIQGFMHLSAGGRTTSCTGWKRLR